MTSTETRRYEMLKRVLKFGEERRSLFPDDSEGGQALAVVAAAVKELTAYGDAKQKTRDEGTEAKEMARQALVDRLRSIARTARVIAKKSPGFADRFKLPKASRPTNQAVLAAGRIFVEGAEAEKARFLAFKMPDTFVTDLSSLVETFDRAIHDREAGNERKAVAQTGLAAALSSGLDAVRALDVIVANQLGGDRDATSAWRHDRKIVLPRRTKSKEVVSSTPADAAGAPTPVALAPPVSTPAVAVEPPAIAKAS